MTFNPDYFKPIDFNAAAVAQCGAGSRANLRGQHIWDWQLIKPDGSVTGFDLNAAAVRQGGPGSIAVSTGVHAYNWTLITPSQIRYKHIPIVLVTVDKIFDIQAVAAAVETLKTHLIASQELLRQMVGKTVDFIAPLVSYTSITSAQATAWNQQMAVTGPNQRDYYNYYAAEVQRVMGAGFNATTHRYLTALFGAQNDGSAAMPPTSVLASEVFTNPIKPLNGYTYSGGRGSECDNVYVLLHEAIGGHALGLPHPPDAEQNSGRVMWSGRPNQSNGVVAVYTESEKQALIATGFLK